MHFCRVVHIWLYCIFDDTAKTFFAFLYNVVYYHLRYFSLFSREMTEQIESLTATLQQRVEELEKYQKMFSDTSKELEQKNEQLNTLKDVSVDENISQNFCVDVLP